MTKTQSKLTPAERADAEKVKREFANALTARDAAQGIMNTKCSIERVRFDGGGITESEYDDLTDQISDEFYEPAAERLMLARRALLVWGRDMTERFWDEFAPKFPGSTKGDVLAAFNTFSIARKQQLAEIVMRLEP